MATNAVNSANRAQAAGASSNSKVDQFLHNLTKFVGQPYLWGGGHGAIQSGASPVDCSGLVTQAAGQAGIQGLAGTADMQQAACASVPMNLASLKPGDLLFVGNPAEHVGVYLGNGMVIQSPHTGANCFISAFPAGFESAGRPRVFGGQGGSALNVGATSEGGGASSGGGDANAVGGGGSPSSMFLPGGGTDPIKNGGNNQNDAGEVEQLIAQASSGAGAGAAVSQGTGKPGSLPTDLVEGAHGGQCGAWMMGERGKMGLPTWPFKAAKDLMWNYPHDKVELVHTPKPGDTFIMTGGQYGHTGFVKSVNKDGTVTVMDSNWGFGEKEHIHNIPMSQIAAYLQDK